MKKVTIIMLESRKQQALQKLQELGVLHPVVKRKESSDLAAAEQQGAVLQEAISILSAIKIKKSRLVDNRGNESGIAKGSGIDSNETGKITAEIIRLNSELASCQDRRQNCLTEAQRIAALKDFDVELLQNIADNTLPLFLYKVYKKELNKIEEKDYFIVGEDKNSFYLLKIDRPLSDDSIEPFTLPKKSLTKIKQETEELGKKITSLKESIAQRHVWLPLLRRELQNQANRIEFELIKAGLDVDEELCYLTGFLPLENIVNLQQYAIGQGWGLLTEDPGENEPVPTVVRNNPMTNLLKPILGFLQIAPGYREAEINNFFFLFLSLFFAMLVGDGGYALIFIAATLFGMVKMGPKLPLCSALWFSLCTLAWGAATGNWFGSQQILDSVPLLQRLVVPAIAAFSDDSNNAIITENLQKLCFIIAAVHLTLGHFIALIRKRFSFAALDDLGRIGVVAGLYFLVLNLVLGAENYPFPFDFSNRWFTIMLAGVGVSFLSSVAMKIAAGKSILIAFFSTVGDISFWLGFVSFLGDSISYIRLYAVGLASIQIAISFNGLAAPLAEGWTFALAVLIVLLGHTLNIAMALLSVLVHGIRLNILEFSGHLGLEWLGIPYKPFVAIKE